MKNTLLLCAWALTLILASCGSAPEPTAPTGDHHAVTSDGKAPRMPNEGKQLPAEEVLGSTTKRILRYQPADEVAEYIDPKELDMYISKMSGAIRRNIGKLDPESPAYGTVVFGLNSKGEQRTWYVFPESKPSAAFKAAMDAASAEIAKPVVKKELVTFGIALTLWGFQESHEQAGRVILPQEWQDAGKAFSTPQKATKLAALAWDRHSS